MSRRYPAAPVHPMMPEHPSAALIGLMTARHLTLLARVEAMAHELRARPGRNINRKTVLAALDAIVAEARA